VNSGEQLPDAVVRYAAHEDGLVDVHLPAGPGPHPLVVYVHGGFWKQEYDRLHARPLCRALAAEGYVVAVPEYRRVGGGGGWPTTLHDVDAAVAAVPSLLAGLGVTTTRTSYVGHSAGGHLVLWLADQGHPVDRVVGLAPVGDLRAAARDGLGGNATQALLGGGPDQVPERYDAADPAVRLSADTPCDLVVLHGLDDDVVPVGNSRGLVARHPEVDLQELADIDHMAVIDPQSKAFPVLLGTLTP
jgi:acetyl esterase/lipase